MKWLVVLMVAIASQADAQSFFEKLADFQVINCKSESGSQEMAFVILRSEKGVRLRPGGTDATETNDVLTARYNDGVITIADGRYTFLSHDALETGVCSDLTHVLSATINHVADTEPDLFRIYVKASVQTAVERLGFLSDMVTKANADLAESAGQLKAALVQQTKLTRDLGEANAAIVRLRLDKDAAIAEAESLRKRLTKSVAEAEAEALRNQIKGLELEQDRLKRTICKLNPKATFAVCKE